MRRTLLLIVGLVAAPAMASAADMPVKAAMPVPYVAAAYNWTGFYFGGQVGYGWASETATDNTGSASVPPGFTTSSNVNGVLGGFYGATTIKFPNTFLASMAISIGPMRTTHSRILDL